MAIKLTSEIVEERFRTLYNGEYELIGKYTNNQTKSFIKHKICGNIFEVSRLTRFFNESNDCPCPHCREHKRGDRLNLETYKERMAEKYGNLYEVLTFTKMHDKTELKCNNCGTIFKVTANTPFLANRFSGCPKCRENKRGVHAKDPDYLENALKEALDGHEYKWLEPYKGNPKEKHKIQHITCGHIYEVRPTYFRYGDKIRCPECSRKTSKNENALYKEISDFYKGEIKQSDRSQINPYELDLFLPEKNIAIEYNGLFWHAEDQKGKTYHKDKLKKCQEKNIRLIQIFEDEYLNKKDIVISKIKNIIGISSTTLIGARKCTCQDITSKPSLIREFLDKNHIQGYVSSTKTVGLFYNEKLVAVCCFNKLRDSMNKNKLSNSWDLIRYAADINLNVAGGCSKLISYFKSIENVNYIKTLADLRWSDEFNNMYISMGFQVANIVEPRYFYTDGHKRFPRFNFRKDKIKEKFPNIYDEKLTEFQMMDKTNLKRIWDAGKITYEKYFN